MYTEHRGRMKQVHVNTDQSRGSAKWENVCYEPRMRKDKPVGEDGSYAEFQWRINDGKKKKNGEGREESYGQKKIGWKKCSFFLFLTFSFKIVSTPNVGLELTTLRWRVACSRDWANQAPQNN